MFVLRLIGFRVIGLAKLVKRFVVHPVHWSRMRIIYPIFMGCERHESVHKQKSVY